MSFPNKKRKILQEDEYLACMSYFLRRDFYPSLNPHDPLTFEDDNRYTSSRHSTKRSSTFQASTNIADKYKLDKLKSVDAFQSIYTSEDNASFEEILNRMNEERRKRWRHFFNSDKPLLTAGNVPKYLSPEGSVQAGERLSLLTEKSESEVQRTGTINFEALHTFSGKAKSNKSLSTPTHRFETPSSATSLSSWSRGGNGTPRRLSDRRTPALRHILRNATPSRDSSNSVDLSGVFKRTPKHVSGSGGATFKTPKQPKNK